MLSHEILRLLKELLSQDQGPQQIDSNLMWDLAETSFVWFFASLFFLIIITIAIIKSSKIKKFINSLMDQHMTLLMGIVWLMGFLVYCVGMHVPDVSYLACVPMSAVHATEMFLFMSDISAIHPDCVNSGSFMAFFNISHFSAVILSLVFIIKQFGYHILSKLKFWYFTHWGKNKKDIYVFWDINDNTYNLAKNISDQEKAGKIPECTKIFVRTLDADDNDNAQIGINRLFKVLGMKDQELQKLQDMDACYVTSSHNSLSLLNLEGEEIADVFGKKLELESLKKVINKNSSNKLHVFFFNDNKDTNVAAAINLLKDETVKKMQTYIYCYARKCAKTHWLETYDYCNRKEKTEVRVIDSSFLSVVSLKQDVNRHPVQHVKIDHLTGCTDSEFNSLVIGFGETGLESVKFLYEFGSFVSSNGARAKFHCTVIDDRMDQFKGIFHVQTPSLRESDEIELCSCKINGEEYWKKIESIIQTLNYVVIALSNDEITLETVANLCKMAMRWRTTDNRLDIYVRAHSDAKDDMLANLCAEISDKYKCHGIKVETFGRKKDLFTYDHIVANTLLDQAKKYNYSYADKPEYEDIKKKVKAKGYAYSEDYTAEDLTWNYELHIKDIQDGGSNYTIDELEEIERRREQNFCNSLHAATKIEILRKCGDILNPSEKVMDTLSKLEHERWKAYLKANGWQRLENTLQTDGSRITRDTIHKFHADICEWDEIRNWDAQEQAEVQDYDTKVVKTSIELHKNNEL